jgi:hypothetical protein
VRKWYKKVSWIVNGIIIGLIVAGMIDQSINTLFIGALAGLAVAAVIKLVVWFQQRRSEW